eukprot:CAMPEP_0115829236 /NCGR_PEP_ID=MMETSP0287-20121206/993_1 /TAXON_ID=412157 /ORGANISM="Chrysochromulina rotalis, Strain UIO044" /LENGTH=73 /DNA_ID=CAMNT_0003282493 /DNA_START=294 /DNA_END=511 /DNA_ORIENTATION=-
MAAPASERASAAATRFGPAAAAREMHPVTQDASASSTAANSNFDAPVGKYEAAVTNALAALAIGSVAMGQSPS